MTTSSNTVSVLPGEIKRYPGGIKASIDRLTGQPPFTAAPSADNVVTPNTGKVLFVDDRGKQQHIDFLAAPFGLDEAEVRRLAVPFEVERPEGPLRFYVMHPVLSLESRVANTVSLPGYDSPHGLAQARAMIGCAREFMREILGHPARPVRDVLKLNERIYHTAMDSWRGGRLARLHGLEVFDAVLADDERLPEKFRTVRYPQMRGTVDRARQRDRVGQPKAQADPVAWRGTLAEVVTEAERRAGGPVGFVSGDWREHASVRVQSAASLSAIARSGPAQPAAYALRDDDVIQNLVTGRDEYIVVTPGVARYPPPLREAVERYFATNPHFSAEPPPGRDPDMDGP